MANKPQIRTNNSALLAVIADEDTVTGLLLAGVGNVDLRRKTNYLIVDSRYAVDQHAFQCLDPKTGRIYTSRHVRFVEHEFPFQQLQAQIAEEPLTGSDSLATVPICKLPSIGPSVSPLGPPASITLTGPSPSAPPSTSTHLPISTSPSNPSPLPSNTISTTAIIPFVNPSTDPTSHPPKRQRNGPITRSSHNIVKPQKRLNLHLTTSPEIEPSTVAQALKQPVWRQAMESEYAALQKNHTWDLVAPNSTQNVVGCRWIFRVKYLPDGSVDKHKARLVAKGFNQRPGWDYNETFSPVVKPVTIRLVLSIAVHHGWSLRQLDVNNAFLQGSLSEEVFMSQPPGFVDAAHPDFVCRLRKAIYGLKQAPRAWYHELRRFLLSVGFQNSIADSSLFICKSAKHTLFVLVYVDDIIITGSLQSAIDDLVHQLARKFSIKDLGLLHYFLGVEVLPAQSGIFLCQRKYIADLLAKAGMSDCNAAPTPLSASVPLTKDSGTRLESPTDYRALVGSLQYLGLTRPDIAFSVNRLSQFMQLPTSVHWSALRRVLRYLAGSVNLGIHISAASPLSLHAFSDADWAGDKDDFVSTSGYIIYIGQTPISWSSRKQRSIARSSTESEYKALADTAAELVWILNLFGELGFKQGRPPVVYCDNIGAASLSSNPVFHSRMKHIALAYHFVREQVQRGTFRVSYVSTDDQLADVLTKSLSRPRFEYLLSKLQLTNRSSNLREDISKTTVKAIEDAFKEFTTREDIAIVLISQYVANMIRFVVDSYNKPIPAILEIPSKDHPYDPAQDSVLSRVKYLFSSESVASNRR